MAELNVLGAFEKVSFPEFGIKNVKAKIDTGAYTGALHCTSIQEQDVEGGKKLLFLPLQSSSVVEKDDFVIKYVRSSNGRREKRYFISTNIQIAGKDYDITLSLTNRSQMKWPVLIGRRFLKRHHFIVDPTKINR
jgi:hypothetical protein